MKKLNIAFIGAGNMAEALAAGLIKSGHAAKQLSVSDINSARLQYMREQYEVQTEADNAQLAKQADVLVLAVKPQQVAKVLSALGAHIRKDATLISIAAGVSSQTLEEALAVDANWVRVMPNTPCLVGAGMSVLFSMASEEHRKRAEYVLGCSSETAWVEKESTLHAVTAVSGSGPAYFFLLAEVVQATAEAMGIPKDLAGKLATQTAMGAGRMLAESGREAAELRHQVTSPGGTTQAAIDAMYDQGLPDAVRTGILAAEKRSRELERE